MKRKLQADLKLSAAWDGQTLETKWERFNCAWPTEVAQKYARTMLTIAPN